MAKKKDDAGARLIWQDTYRKALGSNKTSTEAVAEARAAVKAYRDDFDDPDPEPQPQ